MSRLFYSLITAFPTSLIGNPGLNFIYAGFRPHATSPFCFGKRDQNQCAEHVQQLEGASPFDNLMEVKS